MAPGLQGAKRQAPGFAQKPTPRIGRQQGQRQAQHNPPLGVVGGARSYPFWGALGIAGNVVPT